MKLLTTLAVLLALSPGICAHGGNYSGPGVTPPGSVGDGVKGSADTVPAGPTAGPATPARPGGSTDQPTGKATDSSPTTTGDQAVNSLQDDLTSWRYWWYYNSKPYLNLRHVLKARAVAPGSDDYFLGARQGTEVVDGVRPDTELIHGTIVPRLIEVLEANSSQQELTSALISLSRLKGDPAFEAKAEAQIAGLLGHSDVVVAEVAAISLGILGSDRSSFALVDLLAGGDRGRKLRNGQTVGQRVRAFAAYGLGQIGHRTERAEVRRYVTSKLQESFERGGASDFDVSVACLLSMGSVPLTPDSDWSPPTEGSLPASTCREAQVEWLVRILEDRRRHQYIRAHAPTALARLLGDAEREGLGDAKTRVVRALIESLRPRSKTPHSVAQSAALALGQLGDSDADELDQELRATLIWALREHSDQQTRNFALISLGQAAGRPGTSGATDGLAATRKTLAAVLESGSTMQRPWAALAIGVMGRALDDAGHARSGKLAGLLRTTLEHTRSPELTSATALSLGILRDLASEPQLVAVLQRSSNTRICGYTMIGLGLMEARGSARRIETILAESKYRPDLVQTAAVSLALMHDTKLVPRLIEMLNSNSSQSAQGAISFSLGNVGDVRAANALIEMSSAAENTAVTRGLALSALGLVADRFELPWNTQLSANTNYRVNPSSLSSPDLVGVLDLF